MVGDHEPSRVLLVPAEGRDSVVVPVEEPRLARRRRGRQERLPAGEGVTAGAHPAREVRRATSLDLAGQDLTRQSVDLDDDQAGSIGAMDVLSASRKLLDQDGEVGVIAADREDGDQDRRRHRVDQGRDEGGEPTGDHEGVDEARQDQERHDLEDQSRDRDRDHRHRGEGRDEDRANGDIEDAKDDGGQEGGAEDPCTRLEIHSGRQKYGNAEGQDADDHGRQDPAQA